MMAPNSIASVIAGLLIGTGLVSIIFEGAVLSGVGLMLAGAGLFAVNVKKA